MYKYRHRTRGHPKLQRLLAFVFTLVMLVTMVPADMAKADAIEHTHIWATTYDSTNHWEYCTVCEEKRNVTAHAFTDHWAYGHESCEVGNYSRRICNCGYSYIYYKPHSKTHIAESHTYWERVHVNKCSSCGNWLSRSECYNENGAINCKNPGKCLVCEGSWPTGRHYIDNGTCSTCKTTFYRISEPQVSYNDDFTHAYIKYIFYPANSSVVPIDTQTNASPYTNGGMSHHGSITKNSDGTYTINLDVIISSSREKALVGWIYDNVAVNGVTCYVYTNAITVWRDHQAPVQNDIIQKDQASANGWATIKQLTLSGTEDFSDIVYLTVSDKATGEKYVTNAAVPVTDGKYSYTCTPSIEGDTDGRTYVVTARDYIGNTSTKEFVISKTDGSAPQLKNGTSLTYTDWNTSKDISLSFFDFGSGGVKASLDNQTDYKPLTKSGEYYVWNHSFGNQVGTSEHTIYVKDALGNAGSYKLTVGNTDSNVYSITYNLNGGAMSGQKTSYTVADSFTLPTPTKTGYTFTGWTGSNGTTPQKTVTINKGTRGNLSYTANWQENKLTVRYHNDGAQKLLDPDKDTWIDVSNEDLLYTQIITYSGSYKYGNGSTLEIAGLFDADRLIKTGYTSTRNWCVGSINSSVKINDTTGFANGQALAKTAGKDLSNGDSIIDIYPEFKANTYTITYNANGGSLNIIDETIAKNNNGTATAKVQYDANNYYILGIIPTRQGYTFKGFYDAPSGGIQVFKPYDTANCLSVASKYYNENYMWKYTGNVTLYAQWTPITWTVKYDANGGSGTMADTKHTYDAYILISNNQFNKTGYTFDGWQASRIRNGKTEWLCANTDNSWISSSEWYETDKIPSDRMIYRWSSHEYSTQTTYIDGDVITLHAQWKPIHYTIKYDANGGTGTMADSTQAYMQYTMIRKNAFIRKGWKFLYWYVSKQENNTTKWIYENANGNFGWYEKDKQPLGWYLLKYPDGEISHNATTIDGDVLTFHAQWQYNPVSVKVPQILIGDHTGKSQFRVKCDDFKAGNIKISVPNSFLYKQTGKADVTAIITAKNGNNTITSTNKVCIYNITTKNGLTAGCWSGSFNIGLTLTKE